MKPHRRQSRRLGVAWRYDLAYYEGMLCLLLLVAIRLQAPSTPVTYQTRAARASVVLKELSALTKVDLQASPQMESEVLVISVKGQPLSEVMSRIATVTSGAWTHEGSMYRLVADETARRKEEQALLTARIANLKGILKKREESDKKSDAKITQALAELNDKSGEDLLKKAKAMTTLTMEMFSDGNSDGSVLTTLLQSLDISELAEVGRGDRVVYSTNPTRMQRSLGSGASDAVNKFVARHNEIAEKSHSADMKDDRVSSGSNAVGEAFAKHLAARQGKIGQVAKALLILDVDSADTSDTLAVELRLYDPKGATIYSANANLSNPSDEGAGGDAGDAPHGPEIRAETPIRYSAASEALMAILSSLSGAGFAPTIKASPDLLKKLLTPDRYDPLSFMATDEILGFAGEKMLPFVADIPDDWNHGLMRGSEIGKESVESVAKKIAANEFLSQIADPAYTVLKPSNPPGSRATRTNRLALAKLINAAQEKVIPTLDDFAQFAMDSPETSPNGCDSSYIMLLVPEGISGSLAGVSQWSMLRFFGSMSPESREALSSGGRLSFATMSAGQRASLERMVYGAAAKLVSEDSKPDDELMAVSFGGTKIGTSYSLEPTEIAPLGLPNEGFFEVHQENGQFVRPVADEGSFVVGVLGALDAGELALFKIFSRAGSEVSGVPKIDRVRLGAASNLQFTFHIGPHTVVRNTLHDRKMSKDAPIISANNLPADFQQAFKTAYDKMSSGFGGDGSNGRSIPPR